MQFTMKAIIAGVVPLLLATHCRLVSGKPLQRSSKHSPMCRNVQPCKEQVVIQIANQVKILNKTAQDLFDLYLKCQGPPFTNKQFLNTSCLPDATFPSFSVNRTSERKEILVALYKILIFFNASLGNITKDQEDLGPQKELLIHLKNTTSTTRGLISNLTCLLCSRYNVTRVDVIYGKSTETDGVLEKKLHGCQVLRKYRQVISRAADILGVVSSEA